MQTETQRKYIDIEIKTDRERERERGGGGGGGGHQKEPNKHTYRKSHLHRKAIRCVITMEQFPYLIHRKLVTAGDGNAKSFRCKF